MVRGARDALLPILRDVRQLSTSTVAAQYAPAVKSSSGAFSWFFSGGSRSTVPLSEPFPDVIIPKPDAPPAHPLSVQTSTLASGTKLAAFDALGPLGGVALLVNAGSVNETATTAGASFLISQLAFRATNHRTTFRLVRELDKIGATSSSKAGRDTLAFALKVNKLHLPEAVEILLDSALNPRFNSWEVKDSLPYAAAAVQEAASNPQVLLQELLHKTAFSGALGQALMPDVAAVKNLTSNVLAEFHAANFVPGNFVLVGAGVELEKFQGFAQPLISSSSSTPNPSAGSKYVGGFVNVLAPTGKAYVAIAFEATGGKSNLKSAATAAVAAALLDSSKSAVPFLPASEGLMSSSDSLLSLYKDTGLIGLSATVASADSSKALDIITATFTKYAKGVTDADLQAAKGKVVRAYSQSLSISEDVGEQLLSAGAYSPGAYASSVAAVSAADVSSFLSKALKTPATVAAYGDLAEIPRYSDIAKRFA